MNWAIKNPFKASVLASLLVSSLWVPISFWYGSALWDASVSLSFAALLGAFLIGGTMYALLLRATSPKRIAIVVSAFRRKQFFSDLLQQSLLEAALKQWECVVKVPSLDYNATHQANHLNELINARASYWGAIVVPIEPQDRMRSLKDFKESFGRPIVFIDVAPFDDRADYFKNSCFVGFDGLAGGRLAAEALANSVQLRQDKNRVPSILVLGSNIQRDRQDGFINRFRQLCPGANITVNDDCRFLREEACRVTKQVVDACGRGGSFLDGIFCTNDEMALGALEAVQMAPLAIQDSVVIIGFDAIQEARVIIDRGDTQLRNSVMQDTSTLASTALERLSSLQRGHSVPPVTLLQPQLYRNWKFHSNALDQTPLSGYSGGRVELSL